MSPSLLQNESKGAGARPWMAGGAGTKRYCNEGKTKQLFHFCPRTSANSSHRVSISRQMKSTSPEEVRDSFCTTHSFLSTWAWEGLCMQSRKRKKKEQAAAAHTSSSQSQWAHADEHLHKPQHWGWASLNQTRSSTGGKYIYTHTLRDILSLSIDTDIKIQGDKDGRAAWQDCSRLLSIRGQWQLSHFHRPLRSPVHLTDTFMFWRMSTALPCFSGCPKPRPGCDQVSTGLSWIKPVPRGALAQ